MTTTQTASSRAIRQMNEALEAYRTERFGPAPVQYPKDVCEDHEYGSEWPCLGCGK